MPGTFGMEKMAKNYEDRKKINIFDAHTHFGNDCTQAKH